MRGKSEHHRTGYLLTGGTALCSMDSAAEKIPPNFR